VNGSRILAVLTVAIAALPAQSVDDLADRLAAAGTYDDETISDEPSPVFVDYLRLRTTASSSQLVRLADHESPVVRCYAVRALIDTEATEHLPAILAQHSRDTAKVQVRSGCTRYEQEVGDVMFDAARDRLTDEQLRDLGEHYVRTDSPLYAREWCLRSLGWREGMHAALRRMAAAGDSPALVALARFGDPVDVAVLADALRRLSTFDENCQFLAAEVSRDPRLLPALTDLAPVARLRLQRDVPQRLRFWLRAIAAQASTDAAAFLIHFVDAKPIDDPRRAEQLCAVVHEAAAAHPSPSMDRVTAHVPATARK